MPPSYCLRALGVHSDTFILYASKQSNRQEPPGVAPAAAAATTAAAAAAAAAAALIYRMQTAAAIEHAWFQFASLDMPY
jgi:hypothetical protein